MSGALRFADLGGGSGSPTRASSLKVFTCERGRLSQVRGTFVRFSPLWGQRVIIGILNPKQDIHAPLVGVCVCVCVCSVLAA